MEPRNHTGESAVLPLPEEITIIPLFDIDDCILSDPTFVIEANRFSGHWLDTKIVSILHDFIHSKTITLTNADDHNIAISLDHSMHVEEIDQHITISIPHGEFQGFGIMTHRTIRAEAKHIDKHKTDGVSTYGVVQSLTDELNQTCLFVSSGNDIYGAARQLGCHFNQALTKAALNPDAVNSINDEIKDVIDDHPNYFPFVMAHGKNEQFKQVARALLQRFPHQTIIIPYFDDSINNLNHIQELQAILPQRIIVMLIHYDSNKRDDPSLRYMMRGHNHHDFIPHSFVTEGDITFLGDIVRGLAVNEDTYLYRYDETNRNNQHSIDKKSPLCECLHQYLNEYRRSPSLTSYFFQQTSEQVFLENEINHCLYTLQGGRQPTRKIYTLLLNKLKTHVIDYCKTEYQTLLHILNITFFRDGEHFHLSDPQSVLHGIEAKEETSDTTLT